MHKDSKIYVAGHTGMVGSAIVAKLEKDGYSNLVLRNSSELDLTNQQAVGKFFAYELPEYVFLAAAKVGGIKKNIESPADMLLLNLEIQNNVIKYAYKSGVEKLMFLGSSCVYPKFCTQPMKEEYLLSGHFEETNEGYALAKVAGLKLCEFYNRQYKTNYISLMPCNLYGVNDHYGSDAHVISSLTQRFYLAIKNNATTVTVWGTGASKREFLYIDDMASAAVYLMNNYNENSFINIGSGKDISIKELAYLIADIVGYNGEIIFDKSLPNGMPRKLLDISKLLATGWKPKYTLKEGLKLTLNDYIKRFETNEQLHIQPSIP